MFRFLFAFLFLVSLVEMSPRNTFAMDIGGSSDLQNLDYYNVNSGLKKIQKKYKSLMEEQGCARNLCLDENEPPPTQAIRFPRLAYIQDKIRSRLNPLRIASASLSKLWTLDEQIDLLTMYQNECLAHLQHMRNMVLLRPAFEAAMMTVLLGGTTALNNYFDPDSYGSSLSFYAALATCAYHANSAIRAGYAYYTPPPHPVDELEKRYVRNQCFIPNQLWPIIIEKLMVTRQNPNEQREALNFLSFTLGLTLYKPDRPLIAGETSTDERIDTILKRVKTFFEDYEPFKIPLDKYKIRANINFFLQNTFGKGQHQLRPLFMHGSGGIGKTHFAVKLVEWIEEMFPQSISYEFINITSPEELEGSASRPGAFVRVLRNKCSQRTKASVVVMDEATWLNKPPFVEGPAKRVFNGDLSTLQTTYFGTSGDGREIQLPMPPMFIIGAANVPIEDENLRSRFDQVEFPMPKEGALRRYAREFFQKQDQENIMDIPTATDKLYKAIQGIGSFRAIQSFIPAYMEALREGDTEILSQLTILSDGLHEGAKDIPEAQEGSTLRQRSQVGKAL
jgi:hypothetical protein